MSEFLEIVNKADAGRVWRVLDEFMDALKEAKPDVYRDLVHDLQKNRQMCTKVCTYKRKYRRLQRIYGIFPSRSDGIRTHGLLVPNQARYQLRYTPKKNPQQLCCCGGWG